MFVSIRPLRFTVLALQRQAARELAAAFSGIGLTPSQAEVITVVGTYGPLSVREVGEYLVCESGSPSRLVQTLVDRGLLARAVSSHDRRASFLTLTKDGRDTLAAVAKAEERYESTLAARLGGVDIGGLSETLRAAITDEQLAEALNRRFPAQSTL